MSTDKNIYVDVWLVSLLVDRVMSEILEDSPLSVDEFAMYGLVSDLSPITSADLVRATGLSPTTVSSMVRRCEARGELRRQENPGDARSSLLVLTERGRQVLGQVVPLLEGALTSMRQTLGGRHDMVRQALSELDRALRSRLSLGPRPYELDPERQEGSLLSYGGGPLRPEQELEARRFIGWIQHRDRE